MIPEGAVPRRGVLAAWLAGCGLGAGGLAACPPGGRMAAVLPSLAGAQAIGRAYLREGREAEASAGRLLALIFGGQQPGGIGAAALRRIIDARLRADFAAGAVVRVDGWMLSVTEARLCALAAVAAAPGRGHGGAPVSPGPGPA